MSFGSATRKLQDAASRWRAELIIFVAVGALAMAGAFAGLQDTLNDFAFSLLKRPASGEVVIVQIDSKSVQEIQTWPWARSKHADVLGRLTAAGAKIVALDIDFSSPTNAIDDERLARSIAAAGGRVVLPSFVQHTTPGVSDELVETNPLPILRDHALIGNANVFAPSGVARRGSLGIYLPDGRYRPTLAGLIGQSGRALITEFGIDFAVDPATLKRLSYVDVLRGRFEPSAVKGKRVIVGATAVELGDRVPVPVYGVIPGVELQALMTESILQGRMLLPIGFAGALVVVGLILVWLRPSQSQWSFRNVVRPFALACFVLIAAPLVVFMVAPVMVETAPALVASFVCAGLVGAREFTARARAILRERSANQLRRAMLNLVVDESSDGVLVTDRSGRIELCNERAAELLSTTRKSLAGRHVGVHLPRFDHLTPSGDNRLQGQTELTVTCRSEDVTLEVCARRLPLKFAEDTGETMIDVYTLRDITARRKTEDAERRANDERLAAERAKSNFIANMSHELRTPLNAIIGFSEMIVKESLGPCEPKYVEFADHVAKSGHHLLNLINNVLEISRIDADTDALSVEQIDFARCAEACAATIRQSRDYKGQAINVQPGAGASAAKADKRLIKHVLINLVSNAIKFSAETGNVTITSWVQGDAFGFQIADDGVGIDPKVMPNLAQLFYQSDQSFTRQHEGMGLGLYLVKRYVTLMGGSVEFDSAPQKGTRVRVTLPGAACADAAAEAA